MISVRSNKIRKGLNTSQIKIPLPLLIMMTSFEKSKHQLCLAFLYLAITKLIKIVATFVRSGYPEAQEVKIDLLFLFMTFLNSH
jgi:hypothetical protein